jgi:hypothetical protein
MGNVPGIVNVLQIVHDRDLFMHNQLLTNELSKFTGDQEILGDYLWSETQKWNDNITVSVIQFITRFSPRYDKAFLPILQDSSASAEVRGAIVRYYRKYTYEPARQILTELANDSTDMDLAIEAESALVSYAIPNAVATQKNKQPDRAIDKFTGGSTA